MHQLLDVLLWLVKRAWLVLTYPVRYLVRQGELAADRQDQEWALGQLARVLAQRTGLPGEDVLSRLKAGDMSVLPAAYNGSSVSYGYPGDPGIRGKIRKTLRVIFARAGGKTEEVTVQTELDWLDLPAAVRGEMITTGKDVSRELTFPKPRPADSEG